MKPDNTRDTIPWDQKADRLASGVSGPNSDAPLRCVVERSAEPEGRSDERPAISLFSLIDATYDICSYTVEYGVLLLIKKSELSM